MKTATLPTTVSRPPPAGLGEPSWGIALLFPSQGQWSEAEYLALQKRTNQLVELFTRILAACSLSRLMYFNNRQDA